MEALRFGTPTGNVWIRKTDQGIVLAENKAELPQTPDPTMEALKNAVVSKYSEALKPPMLVVGSNNHVRQHLPTVILQSYDVHLFFYPNAYAAWVCGAIAVDRAKVDAAPLRSYAASLNIGQAVKHALWELIALSHETEVATVPAKLNAWLNLWIYRCPKIALKDVLHLETYSLEALATSLRENPLSKSKPVIQPFLRKIEGGKR